jgi:hypothetical protein
MGCTDRPSPAITALFIRIVRGLPLLEVWRIYDVGSSPNIVQMVILSACRVLNVSRVIATTTRSNTSINITIFVLKCGFKKLQTVVDLCGFGHSTNHWV